jgi:hypothetical protein
VSHRRPFLELEINGREVKHDFDWEGPAPAPVVDFLHREPVPVFASPALGMYHPEAGLALFTLFCKSNHG